MLLLGIPGEKIIHQQAVYNVGKITGEKSFQHEQNRSHAVFYATVKEMPI